MEKITLYFLNTETVKRSFDEFTALLDEFSFGKARRLLNENDRLLSVGGAYLVRKATGGKPIYYNDHGKPYSDGAFFSVSHSVDLVGIAVASGVEVGLDIEKIRATDERLERRCLSEEELSAPCSFLSLFVAKESLAKATGRGIGGDLKKIPALPTDGKVVFCGETYFRHAFIKSGYEISVSARGEDFTLSEEYLL